MFSPQDLVELRSVVRRAADEELMSRFHDVVASKKRDGSVITEADLAMQQRLQEALSTRWPGFALLGEEMGATEQQRLLERQQSGLWCLDPLDGTSNFAAGIPFFAVSLALLGDGVVQAAVVLDPVSGECFSALRGAGAWLGDEPLRATAEPQRLADAMAMVDLKRLPPDMISVLARQAPYRSQRSFGSVALDWCWVASGRCQVYLHGGQKLWDYAAGSLILAESGAVGGLLSEYDGEWLERLSLTPRIAIAATHDGLLEQWRAWIRDALAA
jgi:myo-inositol-1(or 4)-monophosphatase